MAITRNLTAETFAPTPLWVSRILGSKTGPQKAYSHLQRYTNMRNRIASPAMETLAAEMGVNVRTAQRWVRELESTGLVTVTKRRNQTNVYHLRKPTVTELEVVTDIDLSGDSFGSASTRSVTQVEDKVEDQVEEFKCNSADALSDDEPHQDSAASLPVRTSETDEKTPMRERGTQWVHESKFHTLNEEQLELQLKLRDWLARSSHTDDRTVAIVAYALDARRSEALEWMDGECGDGDQSDWVAAVRAMIHGRIREVAKLSDRDCRLAMDVALESEGWDVNALTFEDVANAAALVELRNYEPGLGVPGGDSVPSVGRTAAYAGGPVDYWTGLAV